MARKKKKLRMRRNRIPASILLRRKQKSCPFKEAGITTIEEVRVKISKNPKYSIFILVRPDGTLRNSIKEIEKAYGAYVESLI